ncbi:CbiX/SirB N-terminal domain-containing protein [Actinocrispum sp. NPDC049592]|uniref:sirohydrochlorin chelatase n=1 Tax=Actinocrispum sp. NPDC049592 TaxID=3154835 RepID=UPI0034468E5D
MTLVLAAHGTRDPQGSAVIYALADKIRAVVPDDVVVAFADVRSPGIADVLSTLDEPAVVVPAFLASGYHVRVDIPTQILQSGHTQTTLTRPFGPSPLLVEAMHQRLLEAGWQGQPIVMAAAGSSDPQALSDTHTAAHLLSRLTSTPVRVGYITATPRVAEIVRPGDFIASWLLAPGLFHQALRKTGLPVSAPIGAHENAVTLLAHRHELVTVNM